MLALAARKGGGCISVGVARVAPPVSVRECVLVLCVCSCVYGVTRHCNVEYRKGMGMCEVGPTTQHDFDVVWKDLDFKIKVPIFLPFFVLSVLFASQAAHECQPRPPPFADPITPTGHPPTG